MTRDVRLPSDHRLHAVDFTSLRGVVPLVCQAVAEVLAGRAAERSVDGLLRRNKHWTPEQRKGAVEAVYAVAVWRRRLLHHAERAEPAWLLFVLLRDLLGWPASNAAELLGLDAQQAPRERPAPESPAVYHSFPDELMALFQRELGAEAEQLASALNLPGPITFRANRLKINPDALATLLREAGVQTRPCLHAKDGLLVVGERPNVLGLAEHQQGLFEVQDEGSQLLGALVEARPGETVVDYCAGAGGKTLQLAADMEGRGHLLVHDVDEEKLQRLGHRARRAGVTCVERLKGTVAADRVFVDAPCSEIGALRRGPDLRFRLTATELDRFPPLQRCILDEASALVRPGGRLVYATCTLRREENQDVVSAFLAQHPEFRMIPPGQGWLDSSFIRDGAFLSLPHIHGTDGFFAVVMQCT
ncbi:MAG: RsmB/NOP family class I SAM-dependent RNA methyltransferase [Myxococcota bacterium]